MVAFSVMPLIAAVIGAALVVRGSVTVLDLALLLLMYTVCGLGITVGFHRLLAHRSFRTNRVMRVLFAVAGSAAGQGPPLTWVAHHRRHHRTSDRAGDPHSPYVASSGEARSRLVGLWQAQVGWQFDPELSSNPIKYCADVARDRDMRRVSHRFLTIVVAGLALPGAIAFAVTGSPWAAATGVLWGGLIRMFLLNNVTYAVNSVCHYWGRRPYDTGDQSRNVAALSLLTFGESWHNNHHAFPRSAAHGLRWYQLDPSSAFITVLEHIGLARDVVRVDAARDPATADVK